MVLEGRWEKKALLAKVFVAPCGFGRSSFRLYEAMQVRVLVLWYFNNSGGSVHVQFHFAPPPHPVFSSLLPPASSAPCPFLFTAAGPSGW